ncbi:MULTISPECIES: cell division protein ZapE [Streptomyces]|uniref:Cell division protein ZapE n=1 Tax=Streptomyces spororaveus TaxID=284039 RepID=A0ABQ3TMK6_9ACTN|nr:MULTISPECIES: cell division protein ZapE [Streptomyces]MCX5307547.1 cell division protein ZapE [Streptomyces sp. NBC_00160]GHI81664.1 cell division protein ZapE [Streptomyces spororaveus]
MSQHEQAMRHHFHQAAARRGFSVAPAQEAAVERLARLAGDLARPAWTFPRPPRDLYVWGPVGRGKSWLVDTFYEGLPGGRKRRLHFHDFFRRLHDGVTRPGSRRGGQSAVDSALDELIGDSRVLVFDEFHAHDAGDAMLIARLFRTLLDRRITLVTTSNYPPTGLMPDPLYHHLFEPTIQLIEERMDVLDVTGPVDFRRLAVSRSQDGGRRFATGLCLPPGDPGLEALGLTHPVPADATTVQAHLRELPARAVRGDLVWFDFDALCEDATGVPDYLALAEQFPTLVLDGVPPLAEASADGRQRFANLVDVACDRDVRLVLIGADPLTALPAGEALTRDLDRTASRLAMLRRTNRADLSTPQPRPVIGASDSAHSP